jgi:hypothetical protein
MVDKIGYSIYFVVVSFLMAILAHIIFMFTFVNSFIPVILLGTSLAILSTSLWPMVSMIVSTDKLATAYGL